MTAAAAAEIILEDSTYQVSLTSTFNIENNKNGTGGKQTHLTMNMNNLAANSASWLVSSVERELTKHEINSSCQEQLV